VLNSPVHRLLAVVALSVLPAAAQGGVQLTSHSYIHNPSGQTHVVFHLVSYKRGLFFGSCGPSTRSLQWEYYIEMKGKGPTYAEEDIEVKDGEYRLIPIESGSITIDTKTHQAQICLTVRQNSGAKAFVGNGDYKMLESGT